MSILTYYQDACKTISANAENSCILHNSGSIVLCDLLPPEIKGLIMFCLDSLTKGAVRMDNNKISLRDALKNGSLTGRLRRRPLSIGNTAQSWRCRMLTVKYI